MSWSIPYSWVSSTLQSCAIILGSELVIDWAKHCFVTKFNNVSWKAYPKYLAFLRYDALCSSPYCNRVQYLNKYISQTKRIGFVPLPLACLVNLFNFNFNLILIYFNLGNKNDLSNVISNFNITWIFNICWFYC